MYHKYLFLLNYFYRTSRARKQRKDRCVAHGGPWNQRFSVALHTRAP
jgi:hypothetical protein